MLFPLLYVGYVLRFYFYSNCWIPRSGGIKVARVMTRFARAEIIFTEMVYDMKTLVKD